MGIREQLAGAAQESQRLLGRGVDMLSIAGRSVEVILGAEARAKPGQNVGLVLLEGATFHVLKTEIAGHTTDSILNQLATFQGRQYRVIRASDNGLRLMLECESKDSRR